MTLRNNPDRIRRAEEIVGFCKENKIKKVLSIGSGGSVTEIEIKNKLPSIEIVCTDYVAYICDRLRELYKDMDFKVFDMRINDPYTLGNDFDMVLFCGSDYVMNNIEYINLLKNFNKMKIRFVYIVNSPYINGVS